MSAETSRMISIPEKKNETCVSPELSSWPSSLVSNKSVLRDIPERMKVQDELLRTARDYTHNVLGIDIPTDNFDNIIAAGHQALWHHCGIWIKNVAVSVFAKATGSGGLHLILDHDICDTAMLLPQQNIDGSWSFRKIQTETKQEPIPLELRPLPKEENIRDFLDTVTKAYPWQFCNEIWSQKSVVADRKMSSLHSIADLITYLQSSLNVNLGLDNILYLPISRLSQSDAFLDFVISLAADARGFAGCYNNGIDEVLKSGKSRSEIGIRHLIYEKNMDLTELPFWVVWPDGDRTSLYVRINADGIIVISAGLEIIGCLDSQSDTGKIGQLKNILHQTGLMLRPKAISLMLFVRLFLADWFVHGAGAQWYEMVTNYIMENYYKVKPPEFGTVTCTMGLPLADEVASSGDLSQLHNKMRDIRHNPEKYIDESGLKTQPVASLIRAKNEQIDLANNRSMASDKRKSAWKSLEDINQKLLEYTKSAVSDLETQIAESQKNQISRKVLNNREYFFGLFPEQKLEEIAGAFTFTGS